MADEVSKAAFAADLDDAARAADASRWSLDHPGDLVVWATVYPLAHPGETFIARLFWRRYPDELPSVKFVDPTTKALNVPKAWPIARGFRPPNDICATWTLEGFEAHPDWRNDPRYRWRSDGNVLLKTLRTLQQELDESFQGRSGA